MISFTGFPRMLGPGNILIIVCMLFCFECGPLISSNLSVTTERIVTNVKLINRGRKGAILLPSKRGWLWEGEGERGQSGDSDGRGLGSGGVTPQRV